MPEELTPEELAQRNRVRDFGKPVSPQHKKSILESVRKLEREKKIEKGLEKDRSDEESGPDFTE